MLYARNRPPVPGAQWTGIVTQAGFRLSRCASFTGSAWLLSWGAGAQGVRLSHTAYQPHSFHLHPSLQIAIEMLESGKVDAVVCVQADENDRFTPKPVSPG